MKNFTCYFRYITLAIVLLFSLGSFSQTSKITVSVTWPNWSSENKVEIYTPANVLLGTITNGYTGCCNNSYSTTLDLGCVANGNNYYIKMYDLYGDGWNGSGSNVTVKSGGTTVLTNTGSGTNASGTKKYFNNTGGGCSGPEMDVFGNGLAIADNDTTPSASDDTDYGIIDTGTNLTHTFTIKNTGSTNLNLTGILQKVTISDILNFSVTVQPTSPIASGNSVTFSVRFNPLTAGTKTATVSIDNNDSNENPYNFDIKGTALTPLTEGPGGVTSDLKLWLKANDGLTYTTGQPVSTWTDQARGSNATAPAAGLEPTYYDTATKNVNFNPVVDFDNDYDTASEDYTYSDTNRTTLVGPSGFYTQDLFAVIIPDVNVTSSLSSMDVFCGDADESTDERDGTGIGFGKYSIRFDNEVLSYCVKTTPTSSSTPIASRGYGVGHTSTSANYNNVGIVNSKNNSTSSPTANILLYNANDIGNTEVGLPQFANVNNSRFFLGRSEAYKGSYDGRVCEVITYSAKKTDANLTQERNRIQSYLAIKYGITLGVNGTSQDYVNSDGTVIWDTNTGVPANDVFNYDIAGIGRDDASDLYQKQSRSVNNASDGTGRTQGVLTMGINSIYNTNKLNPNTLGNKQFLVWGNDGVNLNNPAVVVDVDMSTSISPAISGGTHVQFNGIARTWKVVENGGDIPSVQVAVLKSAIRTASPPDGRYLMFISDTPNFDPTADYRVMTEDVNELGEAIVKTNYDFDGTKYITFGWAPERRFVRSIYFNPANNNYIDMEDALDLNPTAFTVSAWVNRKSSSYNKSILSKRDAAYTQGYDLKINASGQVEMSWKNGGTQTITSTTVIPEDEWHQVAVIYSGGQSKLYIDGVLDKTATMSNPPNTSESFYIGAAAKNTPQAFFHGNIDEVRVWKTALTVDQLHYIMNQEIKNNSNFVGASYFISRGITPTKNEVASIPWSDLDGYYPMSTYTYTNTKDESGNGHQGALRALRTVDRQTAPLPYISTQAGTWDTKSTWTNGTLQTIPGTTSIVDATKTVDWNIVQTNHNITLDNSTLPSANVGNRNVLGLFVDANKLTVDGTTNIATGTGTGYGLTVTHYLNLDGNIDLNGESQLIQTTGSDLNPTSSGKLDKDQQGTADTFTYNYWASPVGTSNNSTNNNTYTLPTILRDGTNPASPATITFATSGYNGAAGPPLKIADYWIWKFANQTDNQYSAWQHVRSTGSIKPGEGYTMKGTATGTVSDFQNYVFTGKPNNGDIGDTSSVNDLNLAAGNDYLVGNPYPSALDANQFIDDNGTTIDGTLYFWEHWGGGSHNLKEYEGGYAMYNKSGPLVAATINPDLNNPAPAVTTGSKIPGRYIPVGQGFFVVAQDGGKIKFNNSQRVFRKESSGNSLFMRNATANNYTTNSVDDVDNRMKFRFVFNSAKNYHRQLLLTIDENTTTGYDWAYDGKDNDAFVEDMYWMIDGEKYVIQGRNPIDASSTVPLGLHTVVTGENTIKIEALENVPESINIYVHDILLNTYHDLRASDYTFNLDAGTYLDRYEITFANSDDALSTADHELNNVQVYYKNANESIVLINPALQQIKTIELFNMLGQRIQRFDTIENSNHSEYQVRNLSTGTYIIKIYTETGSFSKKVLVK